MFTIDSVESLEHFRGVRGDGILSVYLDDAIDFDKLKAVYEARKGFDNRARDSWHLLLPHKGKLTPEDPEGYVARRSRMNRFHPDPNLYDLSLAENICDDFDLSLSDLPLIAFADPDGKGALFAWSFKDTSREEMLSCIRDIAIIANRPRERMNHISERTRKEILHEIKAMKLGKAALRHGALVAGAARGISKLILTH